MRAFVHIGLPKAGSTSIQTWLGLNAENLSHQGICYDRLAVEGKRWRRANIELQVCQAAAAGELVNHPIARKAFELTDLKTQKQFATDYSNRLRKFAKERQEHTAVFSNEDIALTAGKDGMAEAFVRWLGDIFDEVHVVIYLRRQEDLVRSGYSQGLRGGSTQTLEEFVRARARRDFFALANKWESVVGSDRLHLRLLEKGWLVDGDLLADFASVIGADPTGMTVPPRMNEALSVETAEFLRLFNSRLLPQDGDTTLRTNPLSLNVRPLLNKWSLRGTPLVLSNEQIAFIRKENAKSNDKLRKKYFSNQPVLFPERKRVETATKTAEIEEVMRIAIDLYALARMNLLEPIPSSDALIPPIEGSPDFEILSKRGRIAALEKVPGVSGFRNDLPPELSRAKRQRKRPQDKVGSGDLPLDSDL